MTWRFSVEKSGEPDKTDGNLGNLTKKRQISISDRMYNYENNEESGWAADFCRAVSGLGDWKSYAFLFAEQRTGSDNG